MKYLLMLAVLALLLIPQSVLADDGGTCVCPGFSACGGEHWSDGVNGKGITKFDAPPELSTTEAYRWIEAMPAAKARLAEMYGIPREEATEYGAIYPKLKPSWKW